MREPVWLLAVVLCLAAWGCGSADSGQSDLRLRQALLRTDSSQASGSREFVPAGGTNQPSQSLSDLSNSFTAARVARLKEGMVESQVIDLLGPPDQQDNFGSLVTWHYFVDQEASSLGFVREGDSVLTLKYWTIHKT